MTNQADAHMDDLRAELLADGWTVVDPSNGRWWPNAEAAREISESDNPRQRALELCAEQPMRGCWHD